MHKKRSVFRFATKAGLEVKVYRLKPDDAGNLVDLFEHLSVASRYQRFNVMLVNPDPEYIRSRAEAMARVDRKAGAAWLAFANLPGEPGAPVASARYMRLPDGQSAEVSIAVRDDQQQQGIGSALLLYLARHARNNGVRRLVATYDTGNRGVWRLVRNAPYAVVTTVHGSETEVVIDLSQPAERAGDWNETPGTILHRAKELIMPDEVFTTWRLTNGLELRVRAKSAEDAPLLATLYERVSPEKRLERPGPELSSANSAALREATRLAQLSPSDGCVWLAFADLPGQPDSLVASGRFMRCTPDEGEMSVVVRDDMQGQGIGTKMLYFVLDQARAMGVKRMISCFASDNEAVWQILSYSPYHVTWQPRGKQVEVVVHLQAHAEGSHSLN